MILFIFKEMLFYILYKSYKLVCSRSKNEDYCNAMVSSILIT